MNSPIQATSTRSEIHAGWRLLLAGAVGIGFGLPTVPYYTIGIFAPILAQEFGWSYASILGGLIILTGMMLIGGPFVGHVVDRYGPRRVAAFSLAGLGLSYMTLALSNGSLVPYYASWVAMAVAGMGATTISFTHAINNSFVIRRGLALGITLAGIGLFALAVKPLGATLLHAMGWRQAILIIGALPLFIGVPIVLWGLPVSKTVHDGVRTAKGMVQNPTAGFTVHEALRTRAFWILVVSLIPMSFATGAPFPNMENLLRTVRIGPQDIVPLTSLIGITIVSGRLLGGWLMDRIWAPAVGALVLAAAAAGCWVLSQPVVTYQQAMVAIALLGFAAGVEVDLLSYLVARYLGLRSYGALYGTLYGLFAVGAGSGPSLLGYAYDRAGNYMQIMHVCALLFLFAGALLIGLGRYPSSRIGGEKPCLDIDGREVAADR